MGDALDAIREAARRTSARIVLSEGEDRRIAEGAVRAKRDGLAHPLLVGDYATVTARLREAGGDPADFAIVDPARNPKRAAHAEAFHALRRHKGVAEAAAHAAVADPLTLAALLVREGEADGTIGGAVATTSDTVRAALQLIGRAADVTTVSSFFLMILDGAHHPRRGAFVFADCGLVVEPSQDELVQIALSSATSFEALTGETARVAMLSFSTMGSARHHRVDHVRSAVAAVKAACPGLVVDGEFQFDAAFVPAICEKKAPKSGVQGDANVFVFPNLEAGNISYKIAQRIGGAIAIGPVLQGLAKPANDLSRGCSVDDVVDMIAVTGAQVAGLRAR